MQLYKDRETSNRRARENAVLRQLCDSNETCLQRDSSHIQGLGVGWFKMSDYQQAIRDVILKAVDREIPIFEAATQIEAIIMKEIDGE